MKIPFYTNENLQMWKGHIFSMESLLENKKKHNRKDTSLVYVGFLRNSCQSAEKLNSTEHNSNIPNIFSTNKITYLEICCTGYCWLMLVLFWWSNECLLLIPLGEKWRWYFDWQKMSERKSKQSFAHSKWRIKHCWAYLNAI